mmetsp:Transcript_28377/g.42202  ORF Transcript_28377/g.42202 Transcript_28377/m.42202 type:complete len:81 (+) Transcript_28377:212-454(+)
MWRWGEGICFDVLKKPTAVVSMTFEVSAELSLFLLVFHHCTSVCFRGLWCWQKEKIAYIFFASSSGFYRDEKKDHIILSL